MNIGFICDEKTDCFGKEDNHLAIFCSQIKTFVFHCQTFNKTINYFQVCNFIDDCPDKSDEMNCSKNL